jgi:hypothetical protein
MWWQKLKNSYWEWMLGVELGYDQNVGQKYNGEGGEEVLTVKVEHLDAELCQGQIDYDSNVEGGD